jgi:hypothetical protein
MQSIRVVAKVERHQGELYPRVGFIVTSLTRSHEGGEVLQRPRHGGAVDQAFGGADVPGGPRRPERRARRAPAPQHP